MLLDLLTGKVAVWMACAAVVALVALGAAQTARLSSARLALAGEQRDRATERVSMEQAARAQAERFRATEQEWKDAQNENAVIARKARDLANLGAAAADGASERLRDRAAILAAACRGPARSAAAVAAGSAASAPGDVLADMLGRLGEAGRIVARYAESASISGEQCAADYQALRKARTEAIDRAVGR